MKLRQFPRRKNTMPAFQKKHNALRPDSQKSEVIKVEDGKGSDEITDSPSLEVYNGLESVFSISAITF